MEDIKDIEEKQLEPKKEALPEAPASSTVKIKSPNGFEYLFTIRDEKASTLMFKMEAMEKHWISKGFTPLAQNSFAKPPKIEKECPTHKGEMMTQKTSKKSGKTYFSHSKGIYPDITMCFGDGWAEKDY